MERLEPIPSPPGHLIREFCHRFLPIGVFAIAVCFTAFLWNRRFTGTTTFGEVEPVRTSIVSAEGGTITELLVDRFQTVTNGQVIAVIQLVDSETLGRNLDVARTEVEKTKAQMDLDVIRNTQNLEDMRVRWIDASHGLATARTLLADTEREAKINQHLFDNEIISTALYESTIDHRNAQREEVIQYEAIVSGLSNSVRRVEMALKTNDLSNRLAYANSLHAQEELLAGQKEIKLRATLDGVIRSLGHRVGEHIAAGTALAEITATRSERIIGYIRQPLILEPRPGMPVEIRTRGPERQTATSKVLSVGVDLELVVSPLRLRGFDNSTERGLAFAVELPPSLKVHPGELVDLIVHPLAE